MDKFFIHHLDPSCSCLLESCRHDFRSVTISDRWVALAMCKSVAHESDGRKEMPENDTVKPDRDRTVTNNVG